MKKIFMLITVILLAGCTIACTSGSGGSDPVAGVHYGCVDVSNDAALDACNAPAGIVINTGTVSRSQMIEATVSVTNVTLADWQGYWSVTFDAGCNGASTWDLAPLQQTPVVPAGGSWSVTVGGQCGDMPLGARVVDAKLFDADPAVQLDLFQVNLTLVQ